MKCTPYNPLDQLASTETVRLITAAAKTAPYCKGDPIAVYREAMQATRKHSHIGTVQRVGAPALTGDIATMYMYTMDSDFYKALNRELRLSYGDEDATHNCAEHFLPYTKLMVAALGKLPPLVQAKLWRGIPDKSYKECMGKNQAGDDVKVDDIVTWTSGDESGGQAVARTAFQIFAGSGVSINAYSAFPTEGEVIIPPGSKFRVEKFTDGKKGVVEVRMHRKDATNCRPKITCKVARVAPVDCIR